MTAAHIHLVDVADRIRQSAVFLGEPLDAVDSTAPRNLAAAARRDQALLAIIRGRQTLFPGFQFGADGRPLPVIRTLRRLAEEMGWPESGVVQWLCARTTYLDELRPVDLVADDPERVVDAARRSAERQYASRRRQPSDHGARGASRRPTARRQPVASG